ncbi:thiamine transporter 1 [Drosophila innubila]|uniref:thiamine transporter 1 n=1 Tax=Drosophila innubila TaxID=198719 RepID=UPI00148C099D|nr:thiamine transporter 1 [Drosophila innubila]
MAVVGVGLEMELSWLKVSCLLCVFGFLRELRPSEPYHAEILLGEWYNVTQDQVIRSVYPIGTYSYLALLIVVFLVTDFLRYKPLIIANALTGIVIWSVLIWTTTLLGLQIVEVFYGFYQATEVAYYSYIYAKVDKKYYPRVTSHTRAAMFVGKLVAGLSAQLLIGLNWMNYKQLLYISAGSQVLALLWSFGLPNVKKSLYFHNKPDTATIEHSSVENADSSVAKQNQIGPLQLLWSHFRSAYTNPMVLQWSLWYAIGLAGYLQVTTYMQVVWKSFENEPTIVWNGGVDAALTALAALFALLAGYLHAGRLKSRASLLSLAVLSALEGGCVLLASWTTNIYISYLGYVLFGALYGFTITVASAELASSLVEDSFALIFGINTLVALVLQTLLTLVVVSESGGLNLTTFEQFTVYAFYFIIIGTVYFIAVIVESVLNRSNGPKAQVMEIEEAKST